MRSIDIAAESAKAATSCRGRLPGTVGVMLLAGVDLSAGTTDTAAVTMRFLGDELEIEAHTNVGDSQIDGWLNEGVVAIDAPFGWPIAFDEAVHGWMKSGAGRWPAWGAPASPFDTKDWDELKELLKFRLTDRFVRHFLRDRHSDSVEHGEPAPPDRSGRCQWPDGLAVSAEKIAVTSFRAVRLLQLAGSTDRTGQSGPALEMYPGGALAEWCLYGPSYKGLKGSGRRGDIAGELGRQLRSGLEEPASGTVAVHLRGADEVERRMRESDHVLDAMVAAIVGWAAVTGQTWVPDDAEAVFWTNPCDRHRVAEEARRKGLVERLELRDVVAREGWIHHPKTDVSTILSADPRPKLGERQRAVESEIQPVGRRR